MTGGRITTTAGLYCDYLDRKEQTTSNMLGAMLKQLVGRGSIPEDTPEAFEGTKEHFGGAGPRIPELLQMPKAAITQRQWVVICIDGLDESLAVYRTSLLRVFPPFPSMIYPHYSWYSLFLFSASCLFLFIYTRC